MTLNEFLSLNGLKLKPENESRLGHFVSQKYRSKYGKSPYKLKAKAHGMTYKLNQYSEQFLMSISEDIIQFINPVNVPEANG